MNEQARASIGELQKVLPLNSDTVMVFVTGSQADGSATAQSDLDVYHIVRGNKWLRKHYDVIRNAVAGHMEHVDVVTDSLDTVGRHVNLYGSFEYWAVRHGILVYEDGTDSHGVHDTIADVRLPDCTAQWLEFAKRHMNAAESYVRGGGHGSSFPCLVYAKSVSASLMAALTHDDIRFKFARRLSDIADMLRDKSITRGYRLDMTDRWRKNAWSRGRARLTDEDRQDGARMASAIYYAVREYTGHGGGDTKY